MRRLASLLVCLAPLTALADAPVHWTRITQEKGKRFILDACESGIQTAELSATQLAFDFGQDSETYAVTAVTDMDEGFNVTIRVKDISHLVQIRYTNRKKGLAVFSSSWEDFRGSGEFVADELKKGFKVHKEKNCGE